MKQCPSRSVISTTSIDIVDILTRATYDETHRIVNSPITFDTTDPVTQERLKQAFLHGLNALFAAGYQIIPMRGEGHRTMKHVVSVSGGNDERGGGK